MATTPTKTKTGRTRANGEGSIQRLPDGRWRAIRYYTDGVEMVDGVPRAKRRMMQQTHRLKRDAETALVAMAEQIERIKAGKPAVEERPKTFAQVYDEWLGDHEEDIGHDTVNCYRAAYKHMAALYDRPIRDITAGDLQDVITACPRGRRTRENMRCVLTQMWTYAIARRYTRDAVDITQGLKLKHDKSRDRIKRVALTNSELDKLFILAETGDIDAQDILILCYTGWRLGEFVAIDVADVHLDCAHPYIIGGSKTDAGRDRVVPIHPDILDYVRARVGDRTDGYLIDSGSASTTPKQMGKFWSETHFYQCLDRAGIDNPYVMAGGGTMRHKLTPHNCRHTFASLIGRAAANSERGEDACEIDIREMIGHTDIEMTHDYQDGSLAGKAALIDGMRGKSVKNSSPQAAKIAKKTQTEAVKTITISPVQQAF